MSTASRMLKEKKALLPKNNPVPNRRILVIDDEPEIGEAIRRTLAGDEDGAIPIRRSSRSAKTETKAKSSDAEFDVVVVTHPDKAIEVVCQAIRENRPFAMGFFDVMLGTSMDGIELVKSILTVDSKMFAVFVTAYQDRSVDSIGQLLGEENRERWDYINKPFTEGEILQKARNATSLWDLHRLKEWQEERLSEAHQLLMVNEKQNAVAAFGRGVAHEFGNLLTHIIGNAELALENSKSPEKMKQALELILKASDTATDILKRFRRMNDEEDGGAINQFAMFDLRRTLDEALELLEFQFRKYSVRVHRPQAGALDMYGNRHAMVQVFVNLCINSMHAMPKGGDIYIEMEVSKETYIVRVRDTGAGIPKENLEKVLKPLFTTKGKSGSGLGLSVCKEIIEIDHRGQIEIHNYSKGGVEVTLHLPKNFAEDV